MNHDRQEVPVKQVNNGGHQRAVRTVVLTLVLWGFSACDFKVSNPGPIQDEVLNDPGAFAAINNGMQRDLTGALIEIAYRGGAVARELFPAGTTGSCGVSANAQFGKLTFDEVGGYWSGAQRARWVAEDGIRRMTAVLGTAAASSPHIARAHLWAGYANRLLGENMLEAVFDGGSREPNIKYWERAAANFTKAIDIGLAANQPTIVNAALAGRASARVWLKDWAGAAADAALVPKGFSFVLPFYDQGASDSRNRIKECSMEVGIYQAHTQWNTWYAAYFDATKDPRVPYRVTGRKGNIAVICCGYVPWNPQDKYKTLETPVKLSNWHETELIRAEAMLTLTPQNWTAAMSIINAIRADVGVPPWPAASVTDAWKNLKKERGIELWLEARRLGDLRRWISAGTPGALDPLESDPKLAYLDADRSLGFPISEQEINTNKNLQTR
ncbi:MAG: RagB/SusD family nutrient uptake outer membrane protein [Gemmatimonadetes bacterium]|nr:RagB/SusD family nutrient uptake outer membrane protein [Gemmatimonadota bacterium]